MANTLYYLFLILSRFISNEKNLLYYLSKITLIYSVLSELRDISDLDGENL